MMAELDLGRIKRNVGKMVDQGAPEQEIDAYISGEGTTIDAVKSFADRASKFDAQISAERAMSPQEYETHIREKVKEGQPYRPQPGSVGLFSNQVFDPFGIRDELVGAGQFVRGFVTSGGDLDKASEAYSTGADLIRAEQRAANEQFGIVPDVIGGLGTGTIAKSFKMAPTFLGRVGQSAKAGAGYSAAASAGRAEGGIGERAAAAGQGAATGAVLGPVLTEVAAPAVGAVVRGTKAGARGLSDAVRSVRGQEANKLARLNRALEQQNMTPNMLLRRIDKVQQTAKFGKTQLDPRFTIADTGPVTADLADTAALVSPKARQISGDFLRERSRGQFGRINDYLRRTLQVTRDNFAKTKARLIDDQQRLSKTAYDDFRNMDVTIPVGDVLYSRQIDDLAAAPAMQKTLQRAREQFVAATAKRDLTFVGRRSHARQMEALRKELNSSRDQLRALRRERQDATTAALRRELTERIRDQEDTVTSLGRDLQSMRAGKPAKAYATQAYTELTPARFDSGKRALDDMIGEAKRAGRGNEVRLLTELKNQLVAVADKATTVPGTNRSLYAEARDVYGSRAELLDALDEGRKFMRGDTEMTGAQYKGLSTAERKMFRIGIAREMRKTLGGKQLGHDMIGIFDKQNTRDVLAEIMSPAQFKKFYQLVDLEGAMAATSNAVRGNSKTALRQQNVLDFSFGVRLGRAIKDKGLYEALKSEVADQITKAMAMRDADAVRLTQALFETDPQAQRAIGNDLVRQFGGKNSRVLVNRAERIARRAIATARRGLAGPLSEQSQGLLD